MKLHTQIKQLQSKMDRLQQRDIPAVIVYDLRTGQCSGGFDWSPGMPFNGTVIYRGGYGPGTREAVNSA